jgi:hypothetical protein
MTDAAPSNKQYTAPVAGTFPTPNSTNVSPVEEETGIRRNPWLEVTPTELTLHQPRLDETLEILAYDRSRLDGRTRVEVVATTLLVLVENVAKALMSLLIFPNGVVSVRLKTNTPTNTPTAISTADRKNSFLFIFIH